MRLKESIRRILSLEWMVAGAAAPFLMFPTVRPRWTATALAVLVVWWLLRWAVRGEPWPVTPFNGALLLFALMVPVGIWASPAREATLPDAVRVTLGLIVFRAVAMAVNERHKVVPAVGVFCLTGLVLIRGRPFGHSVVG